MWINSATGRRVFTWAIRLLVLWLFTGVVWLTFINKAQLSLDSRTAAKRLLGPSTVQAHIQQRGVAGTQKSSDNGNGSNNDAVAVINAFTTISIPLH